MLEVLLDIEVTFMILFEFCYVHDTFFDFFFNFVAV